MNMNKNNNTQRIIFPLVYRRSVVFLSVLKCVRCFGISRSQTWLFLILFGCLFFLFSSFFFCYSMRSSWIRSECEWKEKNVSNCWTVWRTFPHRLFIYTIRFSVPFVCIVRGCRQTNTFVISVEIVRCKYLSVFRRSRCMYVRWW